MKEINQSPFHINQSSRDFITFYNYFTGKLREFYFTEGSQARDVFQLNLAKGTRGKVKFSIFRKRSSTAFYNKNHVLSFSHYKNPQSCYNKFSVQDDVRGAGGGEGVRFMIVPWNSYITKPYSGKLPSSEGIIGRLFCSKVEKSYKTSIMTSIYYIMMLNSLKNVNFLLICYW